MGVSGYAIMKQLIVNMTFFKDGSSLSSCPALQQDSTYSYDKLSATPLQIEPDPYLYCNGVFYEFVNATWNLT